MNELKLTQIKLFSLFHFKCLSADESELICTAHFANNEGFLYHSNLSFQISNFIYMSTVCILYVR